VTQVAKIFGCDRDVMRRTVMNLGAVMNLKSILCSELIAHAEEVDCSSKFLVSLAEFTSPLARFGSWRGNSNVRVYAPDEISFVEMRCFLALVLTSQALL
jgi:hypothetical protein